MPRFGILVDLTRCVGCGACTIACQAQNGLEPEEVWCQVQSREDGRFPTVTKRFLTVQCMHCDNPPCVNVCPTGANYKRKDGLVLINERRCIGCKYCVVACPYQARAFSEERGTPGKCRLCQPRIEKGVQPACVLACPAEARAFGDLDDPGSRIAHLVVTKKAVLLIPSEN